MQRSARVSDTHAVPDDYAASDITPIQHVPVRSVVCRNAQPATEILGLDPAMGGRGPFGEDNR
jgi:hypothetical protein